MEICNSAQPWVGSFPANPCRLMFALRNALRPTARVSSYFRVPTAKKAPAFNAKAVAPDGSFKDVKLEDYAGKYVVLLFYPLDFTFVCPTEIIAFSEAKDRFAKLNAEVLAISVDSHFTHLAWTEKPRKEGGLGKLKIPLVADLGGRIARDYGVLHEEAQVALRGLFVIDTTGTVRASVVHDLPVGRNVDEAIRIIEAFQHVETHGEVCPVGWQKGGDTIIPDVQKSKQYFEKAN